MGLGVEVARTIEPVASTSRDSGRTRSGEPLPEGGARDVLPEGKAKEQAIREMFDTIAPRYDLVNRIMTFRLNDVTARDLQRSDGQWTRAKGFDTFCPAAETPVPVEDLAGLTIITRVNGVERQRGSSADMAFAIPMLLSYISHIMTLEAGDLIATGTPAGVGPLTDGDTVEVEIVGTSTVSNPVLAEPEGRA
jgi:hypothetical protein